MPLKNNKFDVFNLNYFRFVYFCGSITTCLLLLSLLCPVLGGKKHLAYGSNFFYIRFFTTAKYLNHIMTIIVTLNFGECARNTITTTELKNKEAYADFLYYLELGVVRIACSNID